MVQGMGIASFTCGSFHSYDTGLFSSLNENYKFMNLLAKIKALLKKEKVLTFLFKNGSHKP